MNEYPSIGQAPMAAAQITDHLRQITRLRGEDVREIRNLGGKYVRGRLRENRLAPTSHSDIQDSDQLGDIVRTATYEYLVVNDAGALKWARHAIDVTW